MKCVKKFISVPGKVYLKHDCYGYNNSRRFLVDLLIIYRSQFQSMLFQEDRMFQFYVCSVLSSITHSLGKKSGWHCTCLEYVLSESGRAFHVQQALEYPWRALKLDVNWTFNETSSILSKRTSQKFFPLEKQISIEKHSVLNIGIHSII